MRSTFGTITVRKNGRGEATSLVAWLCQPYRWQQVRAQGVPAEF